MRIAWTVAAGSFAAYVLTGCGSVALSGGPGSPSSLPVERGVHFLNATLTSDSSVPTNPGGPNIRVSGSVVSGSGPVVGAGAIKAYVLDGPPGGGKSAVATIGVHDGTLSQSFQVIGPGGNKLRLDYVDDGKVLASTVVKD